MGDEEIIQSSTQRLDREEGPDQDIVFSSRIRLARNLRSQPFPMLATNQQSGSVLEEVKNVLHNKDLRMMDQFRLIGLQDLNELQKTSACREASDQS